MVVKVYISGISGNKEVKKRQQRVLMILDSKSVKYEVIDITEPGKEDDKDFMQNKAECNGGTVSDPNPRSPLPPQVFNGQDYCGDYDLFDLANEMDTLEQFLKLEAPLDPIQENETSIVNGNVKEPSVEKIEDNSDIIATEDNDKIMTANENATSNEGNHTIDADLDDSTSKEPLVDNEFSEDRLKSEEITEPLNAEKQSSKEGSPTKDENGAVSSREPSNEKEVVQQIKENPSEILIESEKAAAEE